MEPPYHPDHRLLRPFGFLDFAHRSTSARLQTGVARSRAIGSGKPRSLVSRIACRRVTRSTSATSASPARFSFRFVAIASMMVSHSKWGGVARTTRPVAPGVTARRPGTTPFASQRPWLRRYSRSGRNPRSSPWPGSTLSICGNVVALRRHRPCSISRSPGHSLSMRSADAQVGNGWATQQPKMTANPADPKAVETAGEQ
jgi:hypothetical protein